MSILVQPNKCYDALYTQCEYLDPKKAGLGLDKFIDFRWKLKCKENPELFELDCIHGENCHRINKCRCTPVQECNLNDRKRFEEWKNVNKSLARNIRRRIGFKQTQAEQQPQQQQPDNHAKSYSNFESFAEEYFRQ